MFYVFKLAPDVCDRITMTKSFPAKSFFLNITSQQVRKAFAAEDSSDRLVVYSVDLRGNQ